MTTITLQAPYSITKKRRVLKIIPDLDGLRALRLRRLKELSAAISRLDATLHEDYTRKSTRKRLITVRRQRVGWVLEQLAWVDLAIEWRQDRPAAENNEPVGTL